MPKAIYNLYIIVSTPQVSIKRPNINDDVWQDKANYVHENSLSLCQQDPFSTYKQILAVQENTYLVGNHTQHTLVVH